MVITRAATVVAAGIRRAMYCFHLTFMSNGSFWLAGSVGTPRPERAPFLATAKRVNTAGGDAEEEL